MSLRLPGLQKIAVFRALQLGDMLCAVPALRALRAAYPAAEIVLLGLPWASSFVQRFSSCLDRFIHFPGYEGLPEQPYDPASFHDFTVLMQQEKFDLLLQMQGNGNIVNRMLQKLGSQHLAGFQSSKGRMNSDLFLEYPEGINEIDRHLLLMQHLGIPSKGRELSFPITAADRNASSRLMTMIHDQPYVIIHPGSRGAWRQWPPQYFAALADFCASKDYRLVVTGTAEECDITRELVKCIHAPVLDLTGKTSLGAIAVLIEKADLLIANCTGVSHIAAALQTPSFIISMDGEPERWGPLNRRLHKVIDWTTAPPFEEVFRTAAEFIEQLPQLQQMKKEHSLL